MITEFKHGNIFDSTAEVLVNPVNTQGILAGGLAAQFGKEFEHTRYSFYYSARCAETDGERYTYIPPYTAKNSRGEHKIIFSLPTMKEPGSPADIELIEIGLVKLRHYMNNVRPGCTVAIPGLGCGVGGLTYNTFLGLAAPILTPFGLPKNFNVEFWLPPDQVKEFTTDNTIYDNHWE
jgi:O-acetyl-ADP-ribose deacetylase (regulator of RNase III)